MKFKHSKGVRIALTSGHVVHVGPEWRELPEIFHHDALVLGCQCDQTVTPEPPVVVHQASPDAVVNVDDATTIRKALIVMIERNADNDFTGSGMPDMRILRREAGIEINRDLALRVFKELRAEAESAA